MEKLNFFEILKRIRIYMIRESSEDKLTYNIAMVAYTNYSTDGRVKREAEALAENGYLVDFFDLKRIDDPSFELINGVNLYHLSQQRYRGNSNFKYILFYVEFFIRIFFKISIFYFKRRYKVIHVDNMPDFLVFTALVPRIFGAKLILDIHDTMPETFSTKFRKNSNSFLFKILLFQERISVNFVNSVISVHYPQANDILRKHGIRKEKVTVVSNFADKKIFNPNIKNFSSRRIILDNSFKLIYHGTIAKRFGFDVVVEGIKIVKDKISNLYFLILGEGDYSKELFELIKRNGLEQIIEFRNTTVPITDLPKIIMEFDLGIVSYTLSKATEYMLPTKLMEYIAMEKPVLCVRNNVISYYIKEGEIEFYDGRNPNSFGKKLLYLYKNRNRCEEIKSNLRRINERLNWENEKKKYIVLIKKLIGEVSK